MDIRVSQEIKNKRILITAGPTWVPIDSVRVIGNIATGETGILLAEELRRTGGKVTLLLGPAERSLSLSKDIRVLRFKFFDELHNLIKKELSRKRYGIVIHSAAVSDYMPKAAYAKKVRSGKSQWAIKLIGTPKIIDLIKKIDRSVFLVGFKYEPYADKASIIRESRNLLRRSRADMVVGNTVYKNRYRAYLIDSDDSLGPFLSKAGLVKNLIEKIGLDK